MIKSYLHFALTVCITWAFSPVLLGQQTLYWYNNPDYQIEAPGDDDLGVDPYPASDQSEILPGVPTGPSVGSLICLVHDVNGDGPDLPDSPFSVVGGDDVLTAYGYIGKGGIELNGFFMEISTFSELGVISSDKVFVRIFDRPSGSASDTPPTLTSFTGQVMVNYPEVESAIGYFYLDGPVQEIGSLPTSVGGFYHYEIGPSSYDGISEWKFYGLPQNTNGFPIINFYENRVIVSEGESVTVPVHAVGSDSSEVTLVATGVPGGAVCSNSTGAGRAEMECLWNTQFSAGTNFFIFTAENIYGTSTAKVAVVVNPPPSVPIRINEIECRGADKQAQDFIELVAPAGISLGGIQVHYYKDRSAVAKPFFAYEFSKVKVPDDDIIDTNGNHLGFVVLADDSSTDIPNTDYFYGKNDMEDEGGILVLLDFNDVVLDAIGWGAYQKAFDRQTHLGLTTNGSSCQPNFLSIIPVDEMANGLSLQAPDWVAVDNGSGWTLQAATPGAVNSGQNSSLLMLEGCTTGAPPVQTEQMGWYSGAAQFEGPNDNDPGVEDYPSSDPEEVLPGTPVDPFVGALVQVVKDVARDGPDMPDLSGNGATGDDRVAGHVYVGYGIDTDGFWHQLAKLSDMHLTLDDHIFMRIFDRPSSTGMDDVPSPMLYTGTTISNYPQAEGRSGYFYIDTPTVKVRDLHVAAPGLFYYEVSAYDYDGTGAWSFVTTPAVSGRGSADLDGDGLTTDEEQLIGTNPELADTDGDGLSDGLEQLLGTIAVARDTDRDGQDDHAEVLLGTDPRRMSSVFEVIAAAVNTVNRKVTLTVPAVNASYALAELWGVGVSSSLTTNDPPETVTIELDADNDFEMFRLDAVIE